MKLFVDDIRTAPDDSWNVARTVTSAINALRQFQITEISLDHDISHQVTVDGLSRPYPCAETFMPVVDYICLMQRAYPGSAMAITIHTSNPVAAREMESRLHSVDLFPLMRLRGAANRLETEL